MPNLADLVRGLAQFGPLLILEKYPENWPKRIGIHKKLVKKGDVVGLAVNCHEAPDLVLAQKILGAELLIEDVGQRYGVRRGNTQVEPAVEAGADPE